jgi:hypothetical protein
VEDDIDTFKGYCLARGGNMQVTDGSESSKECVVVVPNVEREMYPSSKATVLCNTGDDKSKLSVNDNIAANKQGGLAFSSDKMFVPDSGYGLESSKERVGMSNNAAAVLQSSTGTMIANTGYDVISESNKDTAIYGNRGHLFEFSGNVPGRTCASESFVQGKLMSPNTKSGSGNIKYDLSGSVRGTTMNVNLCYGQEFPAETIYAAEPKYMLESSKETKRDDKQQVFSSYQDCMLPESKIVMQPSNEDTMVDAGSDRHRKLSFDVPDHGMMESDYVDLAAPTGDVASQASDEFSFGYEMMELEYDETEIGKAQDFLQLRMFDLKLLCSCIEDGEVVLNKVNGKNVVLIAGKTGVGKSLFVQGIAGKKIISDVHVTTCYGKPVATKVFEAIDPLPGFEVGHDKVSKTKSIQCLHRAGGNRDIVYIDSAGWEDTDGTEVDIATSIMFRQIMQRAKSVRLVILISYASLLEDRGGAIRAVLKLAHTFVSDFEKDKKSFMFLFTHTTEADIPSSILEARVCVKNEILRIMRDTKDQDVKSVLKFMYTALDKEYGFVDVLHPLTSDFVRMSNFIETKLSTIRYPSVIANCGMTPKSELKLIGQAEHMLNSVHRLLQSVSAWADINAIQELKEIKDMFEYLARYVGIAQIQKLSQECEALFQNQVRQLRKLATVELCDLVT